MKTLEQIERDGCDCDERTLASEGDQDTVSNTIKVAIVETEVLGVKAYYAKCLNCDWETRRFDLVRKSSSSISETACSAYTGRQRVNPKNAKTRCNRYFAGQLNTQPKEKQTMKTQTDKTTASAPETRTELPAAENTKAWRNVPVSERRYLLEQQRTIPAEKPTNSPEAYDEAIRLLNQAEAHAAQLAEALQDIYNEASTSKPGEFYFCTQEIVEKALAAYESEVRQ